jgi:broad specificity phosphatase PhoE
MSVRLLLLRHARSTWNAEGRLQGIADPPLDDIGLEQANRLADRLKDQPIAAIYCSPLQRARSTAEIIGQKFPAVTLTFDDRLMEYNVGVLTGLTWAEIAIKHPDFAARWSDDAWGAPIPESEGQIVFRARVTAVMHEIVLRHGDQMVAVVSHGGTFGAYLTTRLGLDVQRRDPFHFGNTSLSVVDVDGESIKIVTLNDAHHLSGLPQVSLI